MKGRTRRTRGGVLAAVLIVLAACAPMPAAPSPTPAVAASPATPEPAVTAGPTASAPNSTTEPATPAASPTQEPNMTASSPQLPAAFPRAIVSVIFGDLAQRLGVGQEAIRVVSVVEVQAPAVNLGCGEVINENEGKINAFEVTVQVKDVTYVYRTDRQRLFPCSPNLTGNRAPIYLSGVGAVPSGRPQDMAVEELAKRLGIAAGEIKVVSVEAVDWPDASLGCPQPGMLYAQVITPGHRVILEAGGKTYRYHGSRQTMILCERGRK